MLKNFAVLVTFVSLLAVSDCAHVAPVAKDIAGCAAPELRPIAANVAQAAANVLVCGVVTAGQLAPCAISGLNTLAVALGPNGQAFLDCVIPLLERDLSKPADVRAGARAYRVMRARQGVQLGGAP